MPEAIDFCEVCRTASTMGGDHLCSDCQQFILGLKHSEIFVGRNATMKLQAPLKIGYGHYGVPELLEKTFVTKCLLCGNSTDGNTLWCRECQNVLIGFSRAIGTWGDREVERVMEGLRNVSHDTWEVFKMMADIGVRDLMLSQLREMHAGNDTDERDSE